MNKHVMIQDQEIELVELTCNLFLEEKEEWNGEYIQRVENLLEKVRKM